VIDGPHEFAASVVRLLKEAAQAAEIGKTRQLFVRKNFPLDIIMGRIESAFGELVKRQT
jgi:hypothetical protein